MANDSDLAVRVQGLIKTYKDVTAVNSLELGVRKGEIYGFLGRNGAGKTSTIRMMLGLVKPNSGSISIFGMDAVRDKMKILGRTGSLVESATAYPNLTVRENVKTSRYFAKPELLILDEPANGLDPAGIAGIRELLRSLAKDDGTTVFVSSHILGEVALLADTIGIIHRGSLVAEFAPDSMSALTSARIELKTADASRTVALLGEMDSSLTVETGEGSVVTVRTKDPHPRPEELDALAAAIAERVIRSGIKLYRIAPAEENLESVFLRLTGGNHEIQ